MFQLSKAGQVCEMLDAVPPVNVNASKCICWMTFSFFRKSKNKKQKKEKNTDRKKERKKGT